MPQNAALEFTRLLKALIPNAISVDPEVTKHGHIHLLVCLKPNTPPLTVHVENKLVQDYLKLSMLEQDSARERLYEFLESQHEAHIEDIRQGRLGLIRWTVTKDVLAKPA